MEVKTASPKETQKVGEKIAKELQAGDVIALYGDLGTGKTVLVQGIARGLKIKRKITSPTFVFMRSYPFSIKKTPLTFYHLDLYRGEENADFRALGLSDVFTDDAIIVLEWAEKIKNSLPKKRLEITIEKINENKRKIKVRRVK